MQSDGNKTIGKDCKYFLRRRARNARGWIQMVPFFVLQKGRGKRYLQKTRNEWNGGEENVESKSIGKFLKIVWWIGVISGGSGVEKYEVSGSNTCLARVPFSTEVHASEEKTRAFDFTFVRAAKYRGRGGVRRVNNPLFREERKTFSKTRSSITLTAFVTSWWWTLPFSFSLPPLFLSFFFFNYLFYPQYLIFFIYLLELACNVFEIKISIHEECTRVYVRSRVFNRNLNICSSVSLVLTEETLVDDPIHAHEKPSTLSPGFPPAWHCLSVSITRSINHGQRFPSRYTEIAEHGKRGKVKSPPQGEHLRTKILLSLGRDWFPDTG